MSSGKISQRGVTFLSRTTICKKLPNSPERKIPLDVEGVLLQGNCQNNSAENSFAGALRLYQKQNKVYQRLCVPNYEASCTCATVRDKKYLGKYNLA